MEEGEGAREGGGARGTGCRNVGCPRVRSVVASVGAQQVGQRPSETGPWSHCSHVIVISTKYERRRTEAMCSAQKIWAQHKVRTGDTATSKLMQVKSAAHGRTTARKRRTISHSPVQLPYASWNSCESADVVGVESGVRFVRAVALGRRSPPYRSSSQLCAALCCRGLIPRGLTRGCLKEGMEMA